MSLNQRAGLSRLWPHEQFRPESSRPIDSSRPYYPYDAKRRIKALIKSLRTLTQRDPEQEVQGLAIPVMAAALAAVKRSKPDDPVVLALVDLFSADPGSVGQAVCFSC
ncbi:MAG: hypothetical protein M3257_09270 [Actinomycetota bacterium]|nr:hypothetical protein [Actinomycetota bacterium]